MIELDWWAWYGIGFASCFISSWIFDKAIEWIYDWMRLNKTIREAIKFTNPEVHEQMLEDERIERERHCKTTGHSVQLPFKRETHN